MIDRYHLYMYSPNLGHKLQNLCTELYLADSAVKQKRLWERVEKAMINLKIPDSVRSHILEKQDVTILAKNVQDWLKQN